MARFLDKLVLAAETTLNFWAVPWYVMSELDPYDEII